MSFRGWVAWITPVDFPKRLKRRAEGRLVKGALLGPLEREGARLLSDRLRLPLQLVRPAERRMSASECQPRPGQESQLAGVVMIPVERTSCYLQRHTANCFCKIITR